MPQFLSKLSNWWLWLLTAANIMSLYIRFLSNLNFHICSWKPNIWKDNLAQKPVAGDAAQCNIFPPTSSVLWVSSSRKSDLARGCLTQGMVLSPFLNEKFSISCSVYCNVFPALVKKKIIFSPPNKPDLALRYPDANVQWAWVTRNGFGIISINSFCHHCYRVIVIVLAVVTIADFDVLCLADSRVEKWLA